MISSAIVRTHSRSSDSTRRRGGWLRSAGALDVSRGMLAILDQGVVSAVSFVTCALIALAGGRFDLGVAHLTLTILLLLTNLQSELVNAPFTVYLPRYKGLEREGYAGSMLVHQLWLATAGLLGLALFLAVIRISGYLDHLVVPLTALLFVAPFCLLQAFLRHFAFACMKFHAALAMDVLVAVIQIGLLLLFWLTQTLTVSTALTAMGIATAVACAAWFGARPVALRIDPSRLWTDWHSNWTFGRWSLSSHVLGCATIYILPWLLSAARDEAATGTLAACNKLSALAGTFVIGVAHFLTPKAVSAFSKHGLRGLHRVMLVSGSVFLLAVGSFCLVVWFYGDLLMVSLFGGEFAGTGSIAVLLAASVLVNSMAVVVGNALWAIHRPQANLIGDGATLVVTLSLALWLVAPWGVYGIAAAMLIGTTIGACVRGITFWLSTREIRRDEEMIA